MSHAFPPLVDWATLLPLMRRHRPLRHIGRDCGLDDQTIGRLARGEIQEPRFGQGIRLLDAAADLLTPEEWREVRQVSPLGRRHG